MYTHPPGEFLTRLRHVHACEILHIVTPTLGFLSRFSVQRLSDHFGLRSGLPVVRRVLCGFCEIVFRIVFMVF